MVGEGFLPNANQKDDTGTLWILFLGALLLHIIDSSFFARPPTTGIIAAYMIFIILMVFFFREHAKSLITVTLVAFFLPWMLQFFRDSLAEFGWLQSIVAVMVFFPIIVLYVMLKFPHDHWLYKVAQWYFLIWCLLGMFALLTMPVFKGADGKSQALIANPWQAALNFFESVIKAAGKGIAATTQSVQKGVAYATGEKYEGTEETQRGIFIDSFKGMEQVAYSNTDTYVQAKVKARNLVETLYIGVNCYIVNKHKAKDIIPQYLTMTGNDENYIDCNLGMLPAGYYEVKMELIFTYETDADIQYYFVDASTKQEQYVDLKIPSKAIAIYTGGPAELGLPALSQPLKISADPKSQYGSYPFGVSLENKWSNGKVIKGLSYTLETPEGITLSDCTRPRNTANCTERLQDNRNRYCFKINESRLETFDSVNCRMKFDNPAAVLEYETVVQKTFNANAQYVYVVEKSAYITVKKA